MPSASWCWISRPLASPRATLCVTRATTWIWKRGGGARPADKRRTPASEMPPARGIDRGIFACAASTGRRWKRASVRARQLTVVGDHRRPACGARAPGPGHGRGAGRARLAPGGAPASGCRGEMLQLTGKGVRVCSAPLRVRVGGGGVPVPWVRRADGAGKVGGALGGGGASAAGVEAGGEARGGNEGSSQAR